MLKLHSNAYANCDQKGDKTCKHFQYICKNIGKAPTLKKNPKCLVKIDMSSQKIII